MKLLIAAAVAATGVALLSGCATMNEDQCRVGDWGGQGWRDGAEGRQTSRLDDHAKACAKYGVVPNVTAYLSAREALLYGLLFISLAVVAFQLCQLGFGLVDNLVLPPGTRKLELDYVLSESNARTTIDVDM